MRKLLRNLLVGFALIIGALVLYRLAVNFVFTKTLYLSCSGTLIEESSTKYGEFKETSPKTISLEITEASIPFKDTWTSFTNEKGIFYSGSNSYKTDNLTVIGHTLHASRNFIKNDFESSTVMSFDRISKVYTSKTKNITYTKNGKNLDHSSETKFEGACLVTKPI